jgi:hypothetical protein
MNIAPAQQRWPKKTMTVLLAPGRGSQRLLSPCDVADRGPALLDAATDCRPN